ncbi:E3 ubiquitin-protein ligase mib2 [Mactra antiquata]
MSVEVEGIRVVRGPDWHNGDDDGGEGHVGTVTQDNGDNTVEVQWDMGNDGCYNTGKGGKCELRVLDSVQLGWAHTDIQCDECNRSNFPGTRWKCSSCSDHDLCTICYFKDSHNTQHPFLRIDAPGMTGVQVPKRSISNKQRSLGIFKGAKVRRGVDWKSGSQDGGDGNIGTVLEVTNHGSAGMERDSVKVRWPNKEENQYRVGYKGKMDLLCVEQAPGMDFYRDHLLPLNTSGMVKAASFRSGKKIKAEPEVKQTLKEGDTVCVCLPVSKLKEAQRSHGGWVMRMADYIGKHGEIKRFEENGDVVIEYDDKEYRFNSAAVMKVPEINFGDEVRIHNDLEMVKALQKHSGGWQDEMKSVLGRVGKAVKIDSDGDVAVSFGRNSWVFNPACCIVERRGHFDDDDDDVTGSGDYEELGAFGGGDRRRETPGKDEDDRQGGKGKMDGGDDDRAPDALASMIELLLRMSLQQQRTVAGPQHLVSAAAQNDVGVVLKILKQNPKLVDQKHKNLTALIISSHEGYKGVVQVLLAAGADTNITDEKGHTALMAALMKKQEEVAVLLIQAGCKLDLQDYKYTSALHFAARTGCVRTLKELLNKGADPNKLDIEQDTPLHDAIHTKNYSIATFIIADQRTNLKLCNKKGFSPLHLAAFKDDEMTASKLLARSPQLKNLSKASDRYTALHIAALNDNISVVKVLLKANAAVDCRSVNQYTPLHLSCHHGQIKTSKLLIDASANVNIQDEDGDTPLHNCVMGRRNNRESDQLFGLLLGIRVSNENEMKERTNLACLLIQNGARITIRNNKGRTPMECCSDGNMRNAMRIFAQKHGGGGGAEGGGASRPQTAASLFSDLFEGLFTPCMGCGEKIADTIFTPCRHRVCCQRCAFRVRQCPRCDRQITGRFDLEGRQLMIDPCKVQ